MTLDDETLDLARTVGTALARRGWTMATAESCTGGGIAHAITEIAGSSAWFDAGFVTYSNASKIRMLGVQAELLNQHGAVSEAVAGAMAQGAAAHSPARATVSTTGIAGPGGAVPGKPVGTVCFGWSVDGRVETELHRFEGNRQQVREATVRRALAGLLARLG